MLFRSLALLPLTLLVANGSYLLQRHPVLLGFSAMVAALLLPLLLLLRQWLGWSYVRRRLMRERVDKDLSQYAGTLEKMAQAVELMEETVAAERRRRERQEVNAAPPEAAPSAG